MRLIAAGTAIALIVIYVLVRTIVTPVALQQNARASTADLRHPPTQFGSPAAVTAPPEKK